MLNKLDQWYKSKVLFMSCGKVYSAVHDMIFIVILLGSCAKGCSKLSNGNVEVTREGLCTPWIVPKFGL
jgi:hypothetical protein